LGSDCKPHRSKACIHCGGQPSDLPAVFHLKAVMGAVPVLYLTRAQDLIAVSDDSTKGGVAHAQM